MVIQRYKRKIITNIKKFKKEKWGENMVVCLENYKHRVDENPAITISLADMLFDKEKRQAIYKQYDKDYVSTKEEDEIYNDMTKRYYEENE